MITVPVTALNAATYTITLILTNFLGQQQSTVASFTVIGNKNLPTLNIVGSNFITVNPSQTVLVYSNADVSSCSESQNIQYSWVIFKAGGVPSGITSSSNDPKTLILSAHTLSAGTIYQAQVTALVKVGETDNKATALVSIQVANGPVVAAVKGGYNRAVFITANSPLTLDASSSTDSNFSPNAVSQGLSFQWSCTITSTENYGQDCSTAVFGLKSATASTMSFDGSTVTYGVTYSIAVKVTASDGRTDSKVVVVRNLAVASVPTTDTTTSPPTYTGTSTYVSSSYGKFNADNQVTVFGYVKADYAVTAQWTASIGGTDAAFSSFTPQLTNFTATEASSKISFPLAIPGSTFVTGSQVTFRIGANMQGVSTTSLYSYSEITLAVNAPPSGGTITSSPMKGVPLMTTFALLTTGWSDDPSDYPL
eukprot:gene47558-biopygen38364